MSTALIMGKPTTLGINDAINLIGALAAGDHNTFMVMGAALAKVAKTTGAYLMQIPLANEASNQLCKIKGAFGAAAGQSGAAHQITRVRGPWDRML